MTRGGRVATPATAAARRWLTLRRRFTKDRVASSTLVLLGGLLSVVLRLPFLSVPLTDDEAGYAYVSSWLARGLTLYRDLWFDRPQGIFLLYGGILWAFGDETEGIRLAAGLYNAATTLAIFALGRRLISTRAAIAAAFVYAVASASPAIEGFTANGELFMNLPSVFAVLAAVAGRPFIAGCLLATAALIKPTALPGVAAALAAAWLIDLVEKRRSVRDAALRVSRAGLGVVSTAAPFAIHGYLSGPDDFWYAVVGFRAEEHSAFSAGLRFFDELRQTGPHVTWALLPVWFLVALWLRRGHWRTPCGTLLTAFLGGTVAGAALGGYWYWHYFVGVLPPAALISGDTLVRDVLPAAARAAARIRQRFSQRPLSLDLMGALGAIQVRRPRFGARWALAALVASLVSIGANASFVGATPEETSWRLYRRQAYLASRDVGQYLRDRTAPNDTVYAAFAGADVYFFSRRLSAGRHLYWTEINRVPGALDAVLRTLDDPRRCPKYVIRLQAELEQPGRADPFWERVERRFFPEAVVRGVILYRRLED